MSSALICEHSLTEFCQCIPRREPQYVRPHVELRGPGERLPAWECQCRRPDGRRLLRNHRHKWEPECIPQSEVDSFIVRTGCGRRVARYLYWMEREFGR